MGSKEIFKYNIHIATDSWKWLLIGIPIVDAPDSLLKAGQ